MPKEGKLEELERFLNDTPNGGGRTHYNVKVYDEPGRTDIQFHGWALVLLPDGTWFCLDTSGG